eukprot:INCI15379.1.p1 GENE.INCI15379.1~~INCI15379.1.p1  ORF type:complete len:302 (-),score=41.51 INCI15379.1:340-1245(-)
MAHFEATPRYEFEELKKIKGQHAKTLNEQRRQTIQVGNSAKQRLKERIQQRIKTEERRRSSMMLNLGHSASYENADIDNATTFSEFLAATDGTPGSSSKTSRRRPFGKITNSPSFCSPAPCAKAISSSSAELSSNSPIVRGANPLTVMAVEHAMRGQQQKPSPMRHSSPVVLAKAPPRRLNSAVVRDALSDKTEEYHETQCVTNEGPTESSTAKKKKKRDFLHMFKSRRDRNGTNQSAKKSKTRRSIFSRKPEPEEPIYVPPKPEMVVHMACQNACAKLSRGEIDQHQVRFTCCVFAELGY